MIRASFYVRATLAVVLAGTTALAGAACREPTTPAQVPRKLVDPDAETKARLAQERADREQQQLDREARRRARAKRRAKKAAEEAAFHEVYPLQGVVYHFLAQVFDKPERRRRPIGYLRRGSRFRAGPAVEGPGCPKGWHPIPGDGFVCRGKGFLIGEGHQSFEPSPPSPALKDALPYLYAFTARDNVPQYWRLPSLSEEEAADQIRQQALAEAENSAPDAPPEPESDATPEEPANPQAEGPERADAVEAPPPPGRQAVVGEENQPSSEADPEDEEDARPDFLRMWMLRGFYVSLDQREISPAGRRFYRTIRGAYVRESDLIANEPPKSRGVVLGGSWQLPLAVVFRHGAYRYRRLKDSDELIRDGTFERQTPLVMADDRFVWKGKRYVVSDDGIAVREPAVRFLKARTRPSRVPSDGKWIHIHLATQTLVAYEGDEPVFATLVTTGKDGFATPKGVYRIESKHVSTTMDDDANPEGAYSIEDVPWTMYFQGSFALHGAFWHYAFGRVRSHGCVNLSPPDARWLFQWGDPILPAAWHGIFADRKERPGTFVVVD